ncbi:MAG: PssE/Cps14G family polysaccharide biosynthesis glycosyltransferase [Planctomycetota bacterium]|jgi:UDP-N-acetylglucosamine transferase subunit ALG13
MIFLTVGTQFPFDRLIKAVDEAAGKNGFSEQIFAQIGTNSYSPKNFESVDALDKAAFDKHIREADSIISHAGIGTITMAFEHKKPLLVMPRLRKYGEVVNNHQVAIANKFEQLGYLLVAHGPEDLPDKLEQLKSFKPRERESDPKVVAGRVAMFLSGLPGSQTDREKSDIFGPI